MDMTNHVSSMVSTYTKLALQPTPKITKSIGDEEMRRLKFAFKAVLDSKAKDGLFIIDNANRQLVSDMFYYAIRSAESRYDVSKGLILAGSIGTGKTTLLGAIGQFRNTLDRNGFKVWSCTTDIPAHFMQTGELSKYTDATDALERSFVDMGFDELGREPMPMSRYGTNVNVMSQLIQCRYSRYKTSGAQSHFTTNFMPDKLKDFYGQFVVDRLKEMCNWVPVIGNSRR